MDEALIIKDLNFCYKHRRVFRNLNLSIKSNTFNTVFGLNSSGKTTLVKILFGELNYEGYISLDKIYVSTSNINEIRRRVGFVLSEHSSFFVGDTVLEELVFNLENLCMSSEEIETRLNHIVNLFRLNDILSRKMSSLNKKEQLIVALSVAMITNPKVLIIDDVFRVLNNNEARKLIGDIKEISEKEKMTVILFSSNVYDTLNSDYIAILSDHILADGNISIYKDEELMNRLGIEIPFSIELSNKLKDYGIIDKTYKNIKDVVVNIWPA